MTNDSAVRRIEDAEKRRQYLELERQQKALYEEAGEASAPIRAEKGAVTDALYKKYEAERKAASAPFDERIKAAEIGFYDKVVAIEEQIAALGLGNRSMDDNCDLIVCALTGLPVFEDDEILVDANSGDVILRAALPWPEAAE